MLGRAHGQLAAGHNRPERMQASGRSTGVQGMPQAPWGAAKALWPRPQGRRLAGRLVFGSPKTDALTLDTTRTAAHLGAGSGDELGCKLREGSEARAGRLSGSAAAAGTVRGCSGSCAVSAHKGVNNLHSALPVVSRQAGSAASNTLSQAYNS
jgi:hypothetical protein